MMFHKLRREFSRHGHGGHGRGFGPGGGQEWGGWRGGWMPRARRGDVKFVVLELLVEGPKHGYEIIGAIEERRGVRPSAGSVYPTLQLLEDGGFVTSEQVDGKRVYTITDSGRALLANRAADPDGDDEDAHTVRHAAMHALKKLMQAATSARGSDDATLEKIRAVLDRARKEIYTILASDEA